ncbi:DUF998 domain-containing protein [Actinopolymorpha sp. NPDC004070]|uniref:DUF998 domain-containing protein n=1 Tax=Actinopolymorpha sp. NPDC004070 TaxID=3154548 RepID=UPI00339DE099
MATGTQGLVRGPVAGNPRVRWLALSGVLGPVVTGVTFTLAGFLRPGYSPVHQPISALGTGPLGWIVDSAGILLGLCLTAFAVAFGVLMRGALRPGARGVAVGCMLFDGLGTLTAGVFTSGPATVVLHTAGATVSSVVSLVAYVVVGIGLRRQPSWRRWGTYSLVAAAGAAVLVLAGYALLMPRSPLHTLRLGGLLERGDVLWHYAWYAAFGLRIFLGAPGRQRTSRYAHGPG